MSEVLKDACKDVLYKTKALVTRDVTPPPRTSNERNTLTLAEAATYSNALKALGREISSWSQHADASLNTISILLQTPVPRQFDQMFNGCAFPVGREHKLVGSGKMCLEEITRARRELSERLQRDVLQPLLMWQQAFSNIRTEHGKVEALRDELDEGRLKHSIAVHMHDRTLDAGDAVTANTVASLANKVLKETERVARLKVQYHAAEAACHANLIFLIKDLSALRDYTAAAVKLMQQAFSTALAAFKLPKYVPDWTLPEGMEPMQAQELAQTRLPTYNACATIMVPTTAAKASFSSPISAAGLSQLAHKQQQEQERLWGATSWEASRAALGTAASSGGGGGPAVKGVGSPRQWLDEDRGAAACVVSVLRDTKLESPFEQGVY